MKNELWYFLIMGEQDNETGLFGNFYSYGLNLGDALKNTFDASFDDFNNPNLMEAKLLDNFEIIEKKDELIQKTNLVYMRQRLHSFPINDSEKEFIPPIGIVKDIEDGEFEYELIKENFVAYQKNENEIYELELVVGKEKLIEVFLKTIEFLPSIDGFWIYIKEFWEEKNEELWVAKHFTDKQIVISFLNSQRISTLDNGYLELVVHSLIGETNLTLDEHKKIHLYTKEEKLFRYFFKHLFDLGYEQTEELYSLEFGFRHWHYRPADSMSRAEFMLMLAHNKFEQLE